MDFLEFLDQDVADKHWWKGDIPCVRSTRAVGAAANAYTCISYADCTSSAKVSQRDSLLAIIIIIIIASRAPRDIIRREWAAAASLASARRGACRLATHEDGQVLGVLRQLSSLGGRGRRRGVSHGCRCSVLDAVLLLVTGPHSLTERPAGHGDMTWSWRPGDGTGIYCT